MLYAIDAMKKRGMTFNALLVLKFIGEAVVAGESYATSHGKGKWEWSTTIHKKTEQIRSWLHGIRYKCLSMGSVKLHCFRTVLRCSYRKTLTHLILQVTLIST